jgi:hypothetical protein
MPYASLRCWRVACTLTGQLTTNSANRRAGNLPSRIGLPVFQAKGSPFNLPNVLDHAEEHLPDVIVRGLVEDLLHFARATHQPRRPEQP